MLVSALRVEAENQPAIKFNQDAGGEVKSTDSEGVV